MPLPMHYSDPPDLLTVSLGSDRELAANRSPFLVSGQHIPTDFRNQLHTSSIR